MSMHSSDEDAHEFATPLYAGGGGSYMFRPASSSSKARSAEGFDEALYGMRRDKRSPDISGTSSNPTPLEDSQKHSYHPFGLLPPGSGPIGSVENGALGFHRTPSRFPLDACPIPPAATDGSPESPLSPPARNVLPTAVSPPTNGAIAPSAAALSSSSGVDSSMAVGAAPDLTSASSVHGSRPTASSASSKGGQHAGLSSTKLHGRRHPALSSNGDAIARTGLGSCQTTGEPATSASASTIRNPLDTFGHGQAEEKQSTTINAATSHTTIFETSLDLSGDSHEGSSMANASPQLVSPSPVPQPSSASSAFVRGIDGGDHKPDFPPSAAPPSGVIKEEQLNEKPPPPMRSTDSGEYGDPCAVQQTATPQPSAGPPLALPQPLTYRVSDELPNRPDLPPPLPPSPRDPGHPSGLMRFMPLNQQFDFRKTDVKDIASTAPFTMGDAAAVTIVLRPLRNEALGRLEPIANMKEAALRAGQVKLRALGRRATPHHPATSPRRASPPRAVDVTDFQDTLLAFDNPLLAISFALWGSLAPYNDLVVALLDFCAVDVPALRQSIDENRTATSPVAPAAMATTVKKKSEKASRMRLRVPFSSVTRFLNHCGVDVLITSPNRAAASSFCARRCHVQRRSRYRLPNADEGFDVGNSTKRASHGGSASPLTDDAEPLHRVLVALSYDAKQSLWSPLATHRAIREVAALRQRCQRDQRRHARREARREKRRADIEAASRSEKAAIEAALRSWQQRTSEFQTPAYGGEDDRVAGDTGDALHIGVLIPGEEARNGRIRSPLKSGTATPFKNVLYPNLVQTDLGVRLLLRHSLHPIFGFTRLRLLIGVPLGLLALLFGIAFLIYVSAATEVCLFDTQTQQCLSSSVASSSEENDSDSTCRASAVAQALSGYRFDLAHRALYDHPLAPGNCLIVTLCGGFAALIDGVFLVYFAVRYLALGSVRPFFYRFLRGVQAVLGAVVCAFAAFVLFQFHRMVHIFSCEALSGEDARLCSVRLQTCDGRFLYALRRSEGRVNIALVLAVIYLVLCVLHWLVVLLPALPTAVRQDAISTATADTYTFRPSLFAPDGPAPGEIDQLRKAMQLPLRREIHQHIQKQDRLLTKTATIGEMMRANREQSLRQITLNEKRRKRRARPTKMRPQDGDAVRRGKQAVLPRQRHYMVMTNDEGDDRYSSSSGSRSHSSDPSDPKESSEGDSVILAPRLMQRVQEIGARVKERGLAAPPTNPLLAADAPSVSTSSVMQGGTGGEVQRGGARASARPTLVFADDDLVFPAHISSKTEGQLAASPSRTALATYQAHAAASPMIKRRVSVRPLLPGAEAAVATTPRSTQRSRVLIVVPDAAGGNAMVQPVSRQPNGNDDRYQSSDFSTRAATTPTKPVTEEILSNEERRIAEITARLHERNATTSAVEPKPRGSLSSLSSSI